ncbi:phage holin family protein [Loigolactobacillus zhaoyuanensis]|uniref:phage holin family protein n=1 Tax=Loigolactobacillus zhaoyuanensis TaxID=2486017 RepID=UPI000F7433EE|nr:phage holin family protein [Loigolactobacillus zhaoyuanensis]
MGFWKRVLVNALIFLALAGFLPHMIFVSSIWMALGASLVLGILNALIKPILTILSLPITILTLGLFSVVINAVMLQLTAFFVGSGFAFSGFGASILAAVIISVVNAIISDRFMRQK